MAHLPNRRRHFTRWLRYVFAHTLPPGSSIPGRIRPHSARAGWATDSARQNTPLMTLRAEGRWSDHRAMMQYVRECLRDLCTSNIARAIPHSHRPPPLSPLLILVLNSPNSRFSIQIITHLPNFSHSYLTRRHIFSPTTSPVLLLPTSIWMLHRGRENSLGDIFRSCN